MPVTSGQSPGNPELLPNLATNQTYPQGTSLVVSPVVKTPHSIERIQVQSMLGELGSHMPCGTARKEVPTTRTWDLINLLEPLTELILLYTYLRLQVY